MIGMDHQDREKTVLNIYFQAQTIRTGLQCGRAEEKVWLKAILGTQMRNPREGGLEARALRDE